MIINEKPELERDFILAEIELGLTYFFTGNYNKAEKMGSRIYFISTGKKIENGLIRLGHDVEGISDRDILNYSSNVTNFKNIGLLNKIILKKTL